MEGLIGAPQIADDSLYLYSIDMERLFGYTGTWNQEQRTLYLAHYNVQTSFADYPLQVDFLSFSLDQSKQGYLTTDANDFTLTGKASSRFYISTTKWELDLPPTVSSPTDISVDENGAFRMPLSLEKGKGLYKVDILTTVATPRGSLGYLHAGHFYVNLLSDGQ